MGNWGYNPYKGEPGSLWIYSHSQESGLQHRLEPQHLAPSDLWMDPTVGFQLADKLQKKYRNSWLLVLQNNKKAPKNCGEAVDVDVTNVIQLSGHAKLSHHQIARIF